MNAQRICSGCASVQHGDPMPRPLALTDDQMAQILRSAQPLAPSARSAFLHDVAQALNGHEIGDGVVARAAREAQSSRRHNACRRRRTSSV
jgi:hypothetical protein